MISNRHRGLVELHSIGTLLAVGVFFWLYANLIYEVPYVRLSREVNLLPYFLCVVIGMLVGTRNLAALGPRVLRLKLGEAAQLATQQVGLTALTVFSMMFATQDHTISRLFLGTFLVFSWLGLLWLHLTVPRFLARAAFGRSQQVPTVFVGLPASRPAVAQWAAQRAQLGIQPVGFVSLEAREAASAPDSEWLGSLADLPRILREKQIGQVFLLAVPADNARARAIIEACQEQGCRLLVHHDIEERLGHPLISVEEQGHHFFTLHEEPLEEPLNRALKRACDLAVALPVVLFVLPPLCLFVWLVQRVQSPGPLFHIRSRSGEKRAEFSMLKFRSMHVAPPDDRAEVRQARPGDDRVFPFGRLMRRHSLDEFPQFLNVLLGDMSVVGPRPYMPLLDEEFRQLAKAYRTRHLVKPGLTGLAQSEGYRGEVSTPELLQERIRLDLYYITHWSIWLDLQITVKTFWHVFFPPPSAY
ncbi:MAG: exopolysaccharide biosynthesis polyprenyl glycosylphosphotransferase [Opitutae bacterium]|nr:exopolysaccharide biosynthesis polyprenyl glycosylphosphotransferase [Opitutae bacterium]